MADVRYLADDGLEGREAGSPGARCAADYLAARLDDIGLEPAGADGGFFQSFPVRVGTRVTAPGSLRISGETLVEGKAWSALGFAASGTVEAPLVDAGSGVAEHGSGAAAPMPELGGRIAVVDGATPGAGGLYADPHFKASVAAGRGAAAVVLLLPPGTPLPELAGEVRPDVGVPVVAVTAEHADAVRAAARAGAPATVAVRVEPDLAPARNVVALLPGSDPSLRDEVVVVGAHYDHLGMGGEGSLAPDRREIHNGADDNASGSAALLAVAEALASDGRRPARSVLFLLFSGEEKGLLGSTRYVEDPIVPLDRTVAMLNMDMVGRLRDNTLTVYGLSTAREWNGLVEELNGASAEPLTLSLLPDGYGPSDHAAFYGKGIPVLHFFTNTHTEYHRPEDDWETINGPGIERVAGLVTAITRRLAGGVGDAAPATITAVTSPPPDPHGAAAPADEAPSRGYGPYLGTIPDMGPVDFGVRLTGVREGSPAEEGGLRGGDVIVAFGDQEVKDLYAYTYALRAHAPGDEVRITVLRDGERVEVTVVLGERR